MTFTFRLEQADGQPGRPADDPQRPSVDRWRRS
jgi:hypothetical protein